MTRRSRGALPGNEGPPGAERRPVGDVASIAETKQRLAETVRWLHARGWTPATSGNFSFRAPGAAGFWITASGIDKGSLAPAQFVEVDAHGASLAASPASSAETLLHAALYDAVHPSAILHTHSVASTVLARRHVAAGVLELTGFEILKGLEGIHTHEARVAIPVFENTQDMPHLAQQVRTWAGTGDHGPFHGFLIDGHGLYAWGDSVASAKRHIEVFEFLFECLLWLP